MVGLNANIQNIFHIVLNDMKPQSLLNSFAQLLMVVNTSSPIGNSALTITLAKGMETSTATASTMMCAPTVAMGSRINVNFVRVSSI